MKTKIRDLALTYYSRKDIQKAIFNFCKNREVIPRHKDKFGKRPDTLEYPSDVIQQAKKGYSSFHCSEELWKDPLEISKEMDEENLKNLRIGWDLLIDIDCKWFDYSKKAAQAVIKTLEKHNIKNIGVKFSGSKGFHIIVPWKAFPKNLAGQETKNLFPDLARKIASYIRSYSEKVIQDFLSKDYYKKFEKTDIKKGIKCKKCGEIADKSFLITYKCPECKREEIKKLNKVKDYKCPECRVKLEINEQKDFYECTKCQIDSNSNSENFTQYSEIDLFDLMGLDIILVSSRHLFRCPYSLHEKGLASIVLNKEEVIDFEPKQADPLKVKVRKFYPEAKEGEARELVLSALDWAEKTKKKKKKKKNFKKVKVDKRNLSHPPCIEKILDGLKDGKKRALFILINYFRSLNLDFEEIEEKIEEWNKKNSPKLKQGYIQGQLNWHKRNKQVLPPNCDKENYKAIGVCNPDNLCKRIKNPVNYTIRRQFNKNEND